MHVLPVVICLHYVCCVQNKGYLLIYLLTYLLTYCKPAVLVPLLLLIALDLALIAVTQSLLSPYLCD